MSGKFVQISCEGKVRSHAPDTTGNYNTLCGLDGDDPAIEHFTLDERAKTITCEQCYRIYQTCKTLKPRDFEAKP